MEPRAGERDAPSQSKKGERGVHPLGGLMEDWVLVRKESVVVLLVVERRTKRK